jgi:hypothetical protein
MLCLSLDIKENLRIDCSNIGTTVNAAQAMFEQEIQAL